MQSYHLKDSMQSNHLKAKQSFHLKDSEQSYHVKDSVLSYNLKDSVQSYHLKDSLRPQGLKRVCTWRLSFSRLALMTRRPMRPKPLIPILTTILNVIHKLGFKRETEGFGC